MSVEFYRGSPGKFDSRTLSRETLSRWTGRIRWYPPGRLAASHERQESACADDGFQFCTTVVSRCTDDGFQFCSTGMHR